MKINALSLIVALSAIVDAAPTELHRRSFGGINLNLGGLAGIKNLVNLNQFRDKSINFNNIKNIKNFGINQFEFLNKFDLNKVNILDLLNRNLLFENDLQQQIIVINENGFYGDNRRFGNFNGFELFDDRFYGRNFGRFQNGRDINLNVFGIDLDLVQDFNRFQFFDLDQQLKQAFFLREQAVLLQKLQDQLAFQRQFEFLQKRRLEFFNRRDNNDLVVVLAHPIQNLFNGVLEKPYFSYDFNLFHKPGSQRTETLVFTNSVTLTVAQTIGPNGETGTATATSVDAIATEGAIPTETSTEVLVTETVAAPTEEAVITEEIALPTETATA